MWDSAFLYTTLRISGQLDLTFHTYQVYRTRRFLLHKIPYGRVLMCGHPLTKTGYTDDGCAACFCASANVRTSLRIPCDSVLALGVLCWWSFSLFAANRIYIDAVPLIKSVHCTYMYMCSILN
jgi:hypothetical protein